MLEKAGDVWNLYLLSIFLEGLFLEKAALAPEYVQNRQSLT